MKGQRIRIGVAGFMGSGKTTCSLHLARKGGVVIDADATAKRLMLEDESIRSRLVEDFGPEVILEDSVCFGVLGKKAFRSAESIRCLNRIVHPPLLERLRRLVGKSEARITVLDAALIPFWSIEDWFDILLWIDASHETRFERLRQKLTLSAGEIERRMCVQENLFSPPRGDRWRIVRNESEKEAFRRIAEGEVMQQCANGELS